VAALFLGNVKFSQMNASRYMRIAANWDKLNGSINLEAALRLLTEDADPDTEPVTDGDACEELPGHEKNHARVPTPGRGHMDPARQENRPGIGRVAGRVRNRSSRRLTCRDRR
jgi:hypothetical protein